MERRDLPAELLTCAQMKEADRLAMLGGRSGEQLMEAAGAAVAKVALRLLGGASRIGVLCGPGANGGDGFVAARLLREAGCAVDLALLGSPGALQGEAARAASKWSAQPLALDALALEDCDLAIDAIFGAGLARPLEGAALSLVQLANAWARASGRALVAVDIPSGIDGDSGRALGGAIEATHCVTFFRLKPGHLLLPGRRHCGRLELAQIGVPESCLAEIAPKICANVGGQWGHLLPRPGLESHKYTRGHVLVASGGAMHTGAARLAARGALRAGAGLVTIASPSDALRVHAGHATAIMLARADESADLVALLQDRRKNAVALGPGLGVGARTRHLVEAALRDPQGRAVVLDADALTSFQGDLTGLTSLIAAGGGPVALTPHEGEFARLFGSFPHEISKLERARAAAALAGAVVVLKGADTVVAAPEGRACVSCLDAPWLATAGAGDVLAGILVGLLAQGMPAFEGASCAVFLHARAAQIFGPGLIAEDIPESLPKVFAEIWGERAERDDFSR